MSTFPVAPYATLSAAELENQTSPLSWIVDELFLEAGAGILGGSPKSCKSFFSLDLCVSIASNTPCAGVFKVSKPGPVLLLCAEDPTAVVSSRLTALARSRGFALKDLPIHIINEPCVQLPSGINRLEATLLHHKPRFVLLDPLIRLHRADENSASEMSVILDGIRGLARTTGSSILIVHHARKASSSNVGAAFRGSSDLSAFGDVNLYLRRLQQDDILELKIEHRAAAPPLPIRIQLLADEKTESARFSVVCQNDPDSDVAKGANIIDSKIIQMLTIAQQELSATALRDKIGVRNQTISQAIQRLNLAGQIARSPRGWRLAVSNQAEAIPIPIP